MKLVTFAREGTDRLGVLVDDDQQVVDCTAAVPDNPALASMQALIESGQSGLRQVRELASTAPGPLPLTQRFRYRPSCATSWVLNSTCGKASRQRRKSPCPKPKTPNPCSAG